MKDHVMSRIPRWTHCIQALVLTGFTVSAGAVTRYVDPAGTGVAPCDLAATPCPLIADALGAAVAGDTIELASGTYNESGLAVGFDVSFVGTNPFNTIIDAGGAGRIFDITGGSVEIRRLTLTNGDALGGNGGAISMTGGNLTIRQSWLTDNIAVAGGAIHQDSSGTLTLTGSTLKANQATGPGGAVFCDTCGGIGMFGARLVENIAGSTGGAIHAEVTNVGAVLSSLSRNNADAGGAVYGLDTFVYLLTSQVDDNEADNGDGGGIFVSGPFNAQQSSISGNSATDNSGAVHVFGGVPVTISNTTLSGNSAILGGAMVLESNIGVGPNADITHATFYDNTGTFGADHFSVGLGSSLDLNNSIVEGGPGANCTVFGATAGSFNLVGNAGVDDNTCGGIGFNLGAVTQLDASRVYNGGVTRTHALLAGSNAIDTGDNALCINTFSGNPLAMDQRSVGHTRPVDATGTGIPTCDIGAFEVQ